MTKTITIDYGPTGEARLRAFVEAVTGGRIVRMERQIRWRPAWFIDVERGDETLQLHIRGEREGDVSIFPELRREADIMRVLSRHGIKVPAILGYCSDPPAILMESLRGSRDVATMNTDDERRSVTREFIANVVAMHKLPVEPFLEVGMDLPEDGRAVMLAGLNAYMPLYQRTKRKPEPMIEFVTGWLIRNVPLHRVRPAFIQFDSGQFLFADARLTGLYDFEFAMIGDPMADIATMRMRDSVEPLGDSLASICRVYEELTGEPVDHAVIEYHSLLFATISTMQFAGTVSELVPGDPHGVYLEFDLSLREVMLRSMSALTGYPLERAAPYPIRPGPNTVLMMKISDMLQRLDVSSDVEIARKDAIAQLMEWLERSDTFGAEAREQDLAEVSAMLERPFPCWDDAEAALEAHVRSAPPEEDARLFALFAAIEHRRLSVFGPTRIGRAAMNVHLPATA